MILKKYYLILFLILPWLGISQNIDVTGRVSLRTLNFDYDEQSKIKPDSIPDREYSKTFLIPGLQQNLNLALFARTNTLEISLLADLSNSDWNKIKFNDHRSLGRLSLNVRFNSHEIVAGDFFESGSELFLQSREIRGGKVRLRFENTWHKNAFIEISSLYGITQKAFDQGARLKGLYRQYETSGLYRRYLASASLKTGLNGSFDLGLKYIYAKDDQNSISESLIEPLQNRILGTEASGYLFDKKIKLFGEGFYSQKDTLGAGDNSDIAFKSGFDLRLNNFKLIAFYQHIGFNYYSSGYPFLLNDLSGIFFQTAYAIPQFLIFGIDCELYKNNLEDFKSTPTTDTRNGEFSLTTAFKDMPELALVWGYRDDLSNSIFNSDMEESKTDKISRKLEGRLSYDWLNHRFSLSATYLDLNDNSKIVGGSPLGTEQHIGSFNFYTRLNNYLFISGGTVYSRLLLTDGKENRNMFFYQSSRYDIIPQKFVLESTLNFALNDASGGGDDDLVNNYQQLSGQFSMEYFFTSQISFKVIAGSNFRNMDYSTEQALQVLQNPDNEADFFNGNESYNALIYGAEINWIF